MDPQSAAILDAVNFEEANYANGPAVDDPFYEVPETALEAASGSMLKVEDEVGTSKYLLPPATAMSRIMYQSENLNGFKVPASAYVLWPYSPRSQPDGYPVVVWAHGTSGLFANAAPSNHKSLWQHWFGPYQLAVNGYVVVAPDYAGLGVDKHASGEHIVHEYLSLMSHANDLIYAIQAAQLYFPVLSKQFVVMGHSQGAGAAWATAQRQVTKPATGYLGAVAIAPIVDILEQPSLGFCDIVGVALCPGIKSVYPGFQSSNVLTEEGQQRLAIVQNSSGMLASNILTLQGVKLVKDGWTEDPDMRTWRAMSLLGGKEIAGPLLVVHGDSDDRLEIAHTTEAVKNTVDSFPSSSINYIILPGVAHDPALPASQRIWMDWITDKFAGRESISDSLKTLTPARSIETYQPKLNWYVASATQYYHAP